LNHGLEFDSYEPHPYFYNKLETMFKDNKNVKLNNLAVWNKNEERSFYFKKHPAIWGDNHTSGGASLLSEKTNIPGNIECAVECIDIVDVIKKHKRIKILKIDTEGAEYHILNRLIESGLHTIPEFIFFEDHTRKILSTEYSALKEKFKEHVRNLNLNFYLW